MEPRQALPDKLPRAMQSHPHLRPVSSQLSFSSAPPTPPDIKQLENQRPTSAASSGVVLRKTVQDFEMGELLGEGSYSTVRFFR
jgi:hypothetical protein